MPALTILMPVFNERSTIERIVASVVAAQTPGHEKRLVVIDDGSTDGTGALLDRLRDEHNFTLLRHPKNAGKGAAIRTALAGVSDGLVLIQDADLEYDPGDYPVLLRASAEGAPVVYGSRNLARTGRGYFAYYIGGRFLTAVLNLMFGVHLTDINTGYKLFRSDIIKKIDLKANRFDFCEEVTAEILKLGHPIREVPIRYYPRTLASGKKIGLRDGIAGLVRIVRCRFDRS
jgi:glycosyltransferase involved in cell wall biosynthesis